MKQTDLKPLPSNISNAKLILAYHALATELWYFGYGSEFISDKIFAMYKQRFAESTIRWWFCKDGPLRGYYDQYALDMNETLRNKAVNLFMANVDKAAGSLAKAMNGEGNSAMVEAAKEWLNRSLGKVPDKFQGALVHGTFAEWMKAEALKNQEQNGQFQPEDSPEKPD